jgi:hypothetical protein
MKAIEKNNQIEVLSEKEQSLLKGGENRDYYVIVIDGKEVRIYI